MRFKRLILLPLLLLSLTSCVVDNKESSHSEEVSSNITSESLTSEESSEVTSTSSEQPLVRDNPMLEPYIGRQYYLNHIGDIYSAWKDYRGKDVTIAVIDAGFNPNHEDFYYKDGTSKVLSTSASFTTSGNNVSVSVGINKVVNMGESHGTFCAGVAAAAINGKGVAGIAPEASLLLLKTDLKPKSIARAFRYAADNGARVVTISIGSYYNYDGDLVNDGSDLGTVFDESVAYCYNKGIVVCSAGGNGGLDNQPTEFTFPGCVDHVIGVGGLKANSSTEIWEGSSYNPSSEWQSIDVLAPADGMFGCCHYDGKLYDGGWNGTSFASPIVAGMAALYFEKYPTKNGKDFERDLFSSCHRLTTSKIATADQLGYGRVDITKLLNLSVNKTVNVKLSCSWTSAYAYVWNSNTGAALKAWPGTTMTKNGSLYSFDVDLSKYDSIIFTKSNNGPQSVDILASSFIYENTYNLSSYVTENNCLIGSYL